MILELAFEVLHRMKLGLYIPESNSVRESRLTEDERREDKIEVS